jgi:hypothetical protein
LGDRSPASLVNPASFVEFEIATLYLENLRRLSVLVLKGNGSDLLLCASVLKDCILTANEPVDHRTRQPLEAFVGKEIVAKG